MFASTLVHEARREAGLTQGDLAALANVPQPTISGIETGRHDANVATVDRLLSSVERRLVSLPTRAGTVSETADAIAGQLRAGRERSAYRHVIQLSDDLAGEEPLVRGALAITAPRLTGDQRFDAFVAAVTEFWLSDAGLPSPAWVSDPARVAAPAWYPAGVSGLESSTEELTPEVFRRHGLVVDPADLVSV